jgi:hypothetical protein
MFFFQCFFRENENENLLDSIYICRFILVWLRRAIIFTTSASNAKVGMRNFSPSPFFNSAWIFSDRVKFPPTIARRTLYTEEKKIGNFSKLFVLTLLRNPSTVILFKKNFDLTLKQYIEHFSAFLVWKPNTGLFCDYLRKKKNWKKDLEF